MPYRIEVERAALKTFRGFDRAARRRVATAIDQLAVDPRPPGCVKLSGREAWRIRVGDYRVVYEIHDGVLVVVVVAVGHRREVYR